MSSAFDDLACFDDEDLIGASNCRETVSDDKSCAALPQSIQAFLDQRLDLRRRQPRLQRLPRGARVALAKGDTALATSLLQGLKLAVTRQKLAFGMWESLSGERMLLARLYLAKGQTSEAAFIARAMLHGEPIAFLYFRGQSQHILDQIDPSSALRRAVPR